MNVVVGSKTLSRWFSGNEPSEWPIYALLDKLQESITTNTILKVESEPHLSSDFDKVSEGIALAYRDLQALEREITELMKGGAQQ